MSFAGLLAAEDIGTAVSELATAAYEVYGKRRKHKGKRKTERSLQSPHNMRRHNHTPLAIRRRKRSISTTRAAIRKRFRPSIKALVKRRPTRRAYARTYRRGTRAALRARRKRKTYRKRARVASLKRHDPVLVVKRQLHWFGGFLRDLGNNAMLGEAGKVIANYPKWYRTFWGNSQRFYPICHNSMHKCVLNFTDYYADDDDRLTSTPPALKYTYLANPNLLALSRVPQFPAVGHEYAKRDGWTPNQKIQPIGMKFIVTIDCNASSNFVFKMHLVKGKSKDLNVENLPDQVADNWVTQAAARNWLVNANWHDEDMHRIRFQSSNNYKWVKPPGFGMTEQEAYVFGSTLTRPLPFKNTLLMHVHKDPLDRSDFSVVRTFTVMKRTSVALADAAGLDTFQSGANPDGHNMRSIMQNPDAPAVVNKDTGAVHGLISDNGENINMRRVFYYKFPRSGYTFDWDPENNMNRGGLHDRMESDPTATVLKTKKFTGRAYEDGIHTWDRTAFWKNSQGKYANYQLYVSAYDVMGQNPTRILLGANIETEFTYRNGVEPVNL